MTLTEKFRGKKIRWTKEKFFSREYKLYSDNEKVGELCFPKFFNTSADIKLLDHELEAFSPSMFKSRMELKDKKSGVILAAFLREKFLKPSEILVGEQKFTLSTTFFNRRYFIKNDSGAQVLEFEMKGWFNSEAEVKVEPVFIQKDEFPVLLVFAWYIIIRLNERHAAAAA
ncbi:MAG: hypothetical protein LCH52_07000 [Bacteroidetes bacterium]|nr:hypothetical protein [Bacteroidota bacterium]